MYALLYGVGKLSASFSAQMLSQNPRVSNTNVQYKLCKAVLSAYIYSFFAFNLFAFTSIGSMGSQDPTEKHTSDAGILDKYNYNYNYQMNKSQKLMKMHKKLPL